MYSGGEYMINEHEARKIGVKKCAEVLGAEYLEKNMGNACAAFSIDDGFMSVFVGVGGDESEGLLSEGGEFEKTASVVVDMRTGTVKVGRKD